MLLSQFPLTFYDIPNAMPCFIAFIGFIAYDYSCADWDSLCNHLRDVPWEDISVLLLLLVNFVSGFSLELNQYQIKPHSSLWFSAACAATIVHMNCFFHLQQKDKSSESKVKFRQARNCCKRVLEAAKLTYANKKKTPSLPRNLAHRTFGELPKAFSTKINLLYLLYSTAWRCCLLHLIKQNCLLKTFLRTLILMTQVSLYLFFILELI